MDMEDLPSLCEGAMCSSDECCMPCPFPGLWTSTGVFGGDLEVLPAQACALDSPGGFCVQIVEMRAVEFPFSVGDGCSCTIALDSLTLSTGQLNIAERRNTISWNTILNNDLWVPSTGIQDRRLERNYEIRDGQSGRGTVDSSGRGTVPSTGMQDRRLKLGYRLYQKASRSVYDDVDQFDVIDGFDKKLVPDRRLQQQDVRLDYDIVADSPADALAISGMIRELELEEIQTAFNTALGGTNFAIGSVYQISDPETDQILIQDGNRTSTNGAPMSSEVWSLVPVLAAVAAMF